MSNNVRVLALFSDPDDFVSFALKGGNFFRLWEKDLDKKRVDSIHEANLEVWVTPGHKATKILPRTTGEVDKSKLDWMVNLKVDAILVNDIELASDHLR
jgi:hypothetical protein